MRSRVKKERKKEKELRGWMQWKLLPAWQEGSTGKQQGLGLERGHGPDHTRLQGRL